MMIAVLITRRIISFLPPNPPRRVCIPFTLVCNLDAKHSPHTNGLIYAYPRPVHDLVDKNDYRYNIYSVCSNMESRKWRECNFKDIMREL